MQWQDIRWSIPLETRPVLLMTGIGHHGRTAFERYHLDGVWCLHLYRYDAELEMAGHSLPIRYGFASVAPPGTELVYRFSDLSTHAYAHFALPDTRGSNSLIPAMQACGAQFDRLNADLEHVIRFWPTNPGRAEVRLWDILWSLAEDTSPDIPLAPSHPAIQQTLQTIELRLSEPLSVAQLAQEAGISHNHLTRLFQTTVGMTVIAYLRQRRIQRARHLLTHSTLSIKAIAAQVGIPDLHLFNKTIRRILGDAPRRLRNK